MISVRNLRVVRRHRTLLDDVSFNLNAGEITALIGPNGAGKSTLMTALVGLCRLTGGTIDLQGRPIAAFGKRELARVMAYVAQKQDFLWDLEVQEVIGLGAASSTERDLTISSLGLDEFAQRRIKTLSGGERSRVMLARALAAQTPLLLADEPAADLDIRQQRSSMRLLRNEVRHRNLGVLVVLHELNLAFTFADRVLLLHHGRLVLDTDAETAAHSPELDRVFGERFTRTTIDGRTVVFPIETTA